jgi:hypothetical protein
MRYSCLLSLLMMSVLAVAEQSHATETPQREPLIVDESNPIEIDARALNLAVVALAAFKAQNKSWRCFDVSIYSEGELWRVDFTASDDVQDTGEALIVGASKCGKGLSYVVNSAGKIIRVIHAR